MFGDWLQQRRLAKGLSRRKLAQRAGISHSAISGWERGVYQPRLPELEAVLAALEASRAQRKRALTLIAAPRAVLRVRAEAAEQPEGWGGTVSQAPCGGDLLRVMRLRRGLTLETVARHLGVHAGTISRWERSEMWPETAHLHALCLLLRAAPAEVAALTCGRFHLPTELAESAAPEEWESHIAAVYRGPDSLRDLRFLSVEAQLGPLAVKREYARSLLLRTYSFHARMLMERNRFAEVDAYAECALDLAQQGYGAREEEWTWAVIAAASAASHRGPQENPIRAARILGSWRERSRDPQQRAWMQSEQALYLAQARQTEAAVAMSEEAIRLSDARCPHIETQFRWRDHARLLALSGRYGEALSALEVAAPLITVEAEARIRHYLLEAQCLLGTQGASKAQERTQEAMQLLEQHGLFHLKPQADSLAQQL